ncbi:MAG: methyltransferase domain-containing protein [Dehalococcoidia bacterium]|nr:methyltransferase domain-containing protein [Dehalococcoidia bacterium]
MVAEREAQATRLRRAADIDPPAFWEERAGRFRRSVQRRAGQEDPIFDLVVAQVTINLTLLDVGVGMGRHVLPLSRRVEHVTAVEPSQAIRDFMAADAAEQQVANLTVAGADWQTADVAPADVVLCSHVIYNVPEVGGFVDKLAAYALQHCIIAMRTGQRDQMLRGPFQQIHGEELIPEPVLVDLYNVVHQRLGIAVNVQAMNFRRGAMPLGNYETLNEAIAALRGQLFVAEGSAGQVVYAHSCSSS